jgi:hypothetical protein
MRSAVTSPVPTHRTTPAADLSRRHRAAFLALNAIGGAAVLTSYGIGLTGDASVGNALWGGIPSWLRPIYTVNMLLAAAGYFLFTPYVAFRLMSPGGSAGGRGARGAEPATRVWYAFHALYALVLIPSALWLPLTERMVQAPSASLWLAIRVDLALVGLGALGLLAVMWRLPAGAPPGRRAALLGLVPFCVQTALLDAVVWPAWYPLPVS